VNCDGDKYTCKRCASGYGLISGKCVSCDWNPHCVNCDGDKYTCKACASGYTLSNGKCVW
jgi:hypothetical protein